MPRGVTVRALLLLAIGCGGTPEDDSDRPPRPPRDTDVADADTDADADSDADADTDTDGDTDADGDSDTDTGGGAVGTGGSGGPTGTGSFTEAGATVHYYVPECAIGAPAPVLYTMHGSGGRGDQMVAQWRSLADAQCFVVLGLDSAVQSQWDFATDVDHFNTMVDATDALYDIDTRRRYLSGYSAGAHWTYVIGTANSDWFGGLVVFAGTLYYAEQAGIWPDRVQRPIPVFIAHGDADTTVPYAYAEDAYAKLTSEGWPAELWTNPGGSHAYTSAYQGEAWDYVYGLTP